MMRRLRLPAPGLLLLVLLGGSAGPRAEAALPNIVLVTLDTTRLDHLGCYGYFRATSPSIDRFAAECLVFDGCIVPISTTLPSHISIFTSFYPAEHGVRSNIGPKSTVNPWDTKRSFTVFAREAGYRTAAFVSAAPLRRETGIDAGFEFFDQPAGAERPAGVTTDSAIVWLDAHEGEPFFLWVHYYDPHYPFQAPSPFAGSFGAGTALDGYLRERKVPDRAPRLFVAQSDDSREATNAYDAEILYMDSEVGRLLERLEGTPRWGETWVLMIGDHGEGLCQHGEAGHGGIWDEQLRVPMLLRAPGENGRRVHGTFSGVDALPTLLGRMALPSLTVFAEGRSGRDALAPSFAPARPVYSEETVIIAGSDPRRYTLTGDEWKYYRIGRGARGEEQLFDLRSDPFELRNVAAEQPEVAATLRRMLQETIMRQSDRGAAISAASDQPKTADSTTIEQLRSLGYIEK
jgi:arylsulfatase